ncbi:MAG: BrnA antitoxin family protein [Chitinispirillaceae bacterium]|nr:BrnA antitoxin family protein [Chitinispirillaceae bacterium]
MKVKNTKKTSNTDWERLSTMDDNEINLEDSPELDDSFFANATIRMPEPKKSVSLRLDPDILEWYKHQGPGYQTRMNAVLRMYMRAKNSNVKSPPVMKKTVKRQLANKKVN